MNALLPFADDVTGSGIVAIDADVIDAARRAMSPNSWRALRADIRVFASWCSARGLMTLPALPATVATFLADQADHGKKAATLARYTASIARLHALADQPDPTRTERVRLELKAQRRALGVRQRQARGLRFRGEVADPLAAAGPVGVCVEAMLAATGDDLPGQRNRALLSLAFDTGLRRSEIVAIRWPHVERGGAGGGRLFVPRSKADQEGAGAYAYLSARTMTALREWRAACGGRSDGALFRRLHRTRDKSGADIWSVGAALSAQSVTLIYRAMLDAAHAAGLLGMIDSADFDIWRASLTAHSTRVGLTQDLFASGQDLAGIMQALRWKSPAQPARYAQALAVESNAAAKVVGKL
ncbi:tyrosine-type recombinase/integrase [Sphingomonas panaciterrae]|uniref:tyrosine-type recombinase/integrase n=1 Tax=Sphingomonas panaciterrae TaxID=1462999 RepID=UPI002FF03502